MDEERDEILIQGVSKQARQVDRNVVGVGLVVARRKATDSSSSLLALLHLHYIMPPANVTHC